MRPVDRLNPYINPIHAQPAIQKKTANPNFKSALNQAIGTSSSIPLKMSKHAAERMAQRQINIDPKEWQMISEKVSKAKAMGMKESLVVTKNQALVVSPQNETVITIMNRDEASQQIFSNIDGAILLG